jgi:hypothetical protein
MRSTPPRLPRFSGRPGTRWHCGRWWRELRSAPLDLQEAPTGGLSIRRGFLRPEAQRARSGRASHDLRGVLLVGGESPAWRVQLEFIRHHPGRSGDEHRVGDLRGIGDVAEEVREAVTSHVLEGEGSERRRGGHHRALADGLHLLVADSPEVQTALDDALLSGLHVHEHVDQSRRGGPRPRAGGGGVGRGVARADLQRRRLLCVGADSRLRPLLPLARREKEECDGEG